MTRPLIQLLALTAMAATVATGQTTTVPRAAQRPPVLTTFALNDGAASTPANTPVVLAHTVVGARPSDYRVSPRADFAGAPWLAYASRPMLGNIDILSSAGCDIAGTTRRLRLYLQVRAVLGDEVRIVNGQRTLQPVVAESNVLADSICVSPPAAP